MRKVRDNLTSAEKTELWARWQTGESLKSIGRSIGKNSSSIHWYVTKHGGIQPKERRRSKRHLSLPEREEILRGLCTGQSFREIGRRLNRSASTISREVERNGGREQYRSSLADSRAWQQGRRAKSCKLSRSRYLCRIVEQKLRLEWSPQQIAGWLKLEHPGDKSRQISHETIYRSLFVQARGVLKKELLAHLRSKKALRRTPRGKAEGVEQRGKIKDLVSISERPAEVSDRAVPGHWEGDLISGTRSSHIATLVERHSRFVMLVKVENKETETVVNALTRQVKRLPTELKRSLTWDRGKELADHKRFSVATNVDVYFCDPRSPWQRGSNENTNGLLRQYFPRGTNIGAHSQRELNAVAKRLNGRPRKTLGYKTPAQVLEASVAMTG